MPGSKSSPWLVVDEKFIFQGQKEQDKDVDLELFWKEESRVYGQGLDTLGAQRGGQPTTGRLLGGPGLGLEEPASHV